LSENHAIIRARTQIAQLLLRAKPSASTAPLCNTIDRPENGEAPGVTSNSLHMVGQAIDIRVADRGLDKLHDTALAMKVGGVGYYPSSNFVHVDVGAVRHWLG